MPSTRRVIDTPGDAAPTCAEVIADRLVGLGVRHAFGVGGANIEDVFAAVQRRRPELRAILDKHEHAAGAAADAYARLSGGLGVVMVTSGGGAMNLVHAVAEARASGTAMLAIIGEPPTDLQGRGAFQDTSGRHGAVDAAAVYRGAARWCARLERADDLPRLLDDAIAAACGDRPGPAVLLIAKDLQLTRVRAIAEPRSPPVATAPDPAQVHRAAGLLAVRPILVVAGAQAARSRGRLARLVESLDARVALTPDGRAAFDNADPRFLGIAGAMGHPEVARALAESQLCVCVGTRLDLLARVGLDALLSQRPLLAIGRDPPFVGEVAVHLQGEVGACLDALLTELGDVPRPAPAPPSPRGGPTDGLGSPAVVAAIERVVPPGAVILVDAGNTGATAVHHLAVPRDGRWLIAMGMGGMGWTFGAAIGAALATGERCFVLAGDGAFFMHGLEIHTAVQHQLPITYVVFDNRAHGMCLVRERLLLGENSGYNAFRRSHIGAGLAAMFPGLAAADCHTIAEVELELGRSLERRGPSLVCVELDDVEIPPFSAFARAREDGTRTVARGGDDADD